MNDYKRIISYIYMYCGDMKSRNVGFAKIGVRDGKCKISISLKIPEECTEESLSVYLDRKEAEETEHMVKIGKLRPLVHQAFFKTILNENNIESSKHCFDEMNGITVKGEGGFYSFRCDWKRKEMVEEKKQEENKETEKEIKQSVSEVTAAEYIEEKKEEPTVSVVKQEEKKKAWWEYFGNKEGENKLYMDEDHEVEYIKVCLEDLQKLDGKQGQLVSNSFLLHGFYQYQYIILGKMKQEKEKRYIIGVPGNYHKNERMMADMFGFKKYVKMSEKDQIGYWCRSIG